MLHAGAQSIKHVKLRVPLGFKPTSSDVEKGFKNKENKNSHALV